MQARFYVPWYGRFASPDPARDQHFEDTQSWNIYSYVRNSPIGHTDPTGMLDVENPQNVNGGTASPNAARAVTNDNSWNLVSWFKKKLGMDAQKRAQTNAAVAGSVGAVATRSLVAEFGAWLVSAGTAALPYVAAILMVSDASPNRHKAEATDSPGVPKDLVGTQDDKSRQRGKRHTSGPLAPEHGGTGDAAKDFGKLTGGKSQPAPSDSSLPPGSRIGDNKIQIRPGKPGEGPRIDIPASGSKPIETLHYPE